MKVFCISTNTIDTKRVKNTPTHPPFLCTEFTKEKFQTSSMTLNASSVKGSKIESEYEKREGALMRSLPELAVYSWSLKDRWLHLPLKKSKCPEATESSRLGATICLYSQNLQAQEMHVCFLQNRWATRDREQAFHHFRSCPRRPPKARLNVKWTSEYNQDSGRKNLGCTQITSRLVSDWVLQYSVSDSHCLEKVFIKHCSGLF